jgi:signal transduction histidine kinase
MSTLVGVSGMGRSEVSSDPTVGTPPTGSDSSADPTHHLPPEVLAGLGAINRVATALVGSGSLAELAERALGEMREALGLDLTVLYLPRPGERPSLQRYVASASGGAVVRAHDEVSFDDEAWRLAVASGVPLLFREEASWLVANPFDPPAQSWLVLPLRSEARLVGVVVAAAPGPISLDPTAATVLRLLGDLLAAGIATARLRQELQGREIERERMRLAAEIHDGLAQDLALAMRELALLESGPSPGQAQASMERLREAVGAAHRVVRARLEDLSVSAPLGGIQAAVEEVCERRRGDLPLDLDTSGPAVDVAPGTTAVVVRVLTEALSNAARHGQAASVRVLLRLEDDRLTLGIEDDGVGFQVDEVGGPGEGHFGLTLMRERARSAGGGLAVRSAPGEGTAVTLRVPVS